MSRMSMIEEARTRAGMSQTELARMAGTSQPTVSAYEHGTKSPTLGVFERLLRASGHELSLTRLVEFTEQPGRGGRTIAVPTALPRLDPTQAFASVQLPLHLNWSNPGRVFEMSERAQRARVYEIVLREGTTGDIQTYVDGALLVDLWDELALPVDVRAAWSDVIASAVGA